MAKRGVRSNKGDDSTPKNYVDNTKILSTPVVDEMKKCFISYAMAVNVSRAIPDVRDGLKPVHRRIIYAMGELGLWSDKPYRKSARIVGDVLGKFHPHGDSAVYDALVRLAQDFSMRMPLVDGHGNFGSIDGDPPAAQRYTEARLTKISDELLRDIDKETVDWTNNFDDSLQEPTVLPSRFPNLLVNGSDGIAVGMATNIPPHNLGEVINAIDALIDDPEITIEDLMKHVPAPDYPTGGLIMGRANIKRAYKTGKGGVVIRAKAEIEEYPVREGSDLMRQRIVVTELPYQVNKEKLIIQIADLVKDKRIEGIADIKEESDRSGMRIVIEVKRDAQAQVVLNTLYKHTNLQVSTGITFLALADGEPKILNLKEMLELYLKHQLEIIVRRTRHDLAAAQERAHIVEGLVKAQANIDKVIKIIKQSRDNVEAAEKLMAEFYLSDKQANAILEMKLRRLTSLEIDALQNELTALNEKIADFKSILASPKRVSDIVKAELQEIKEQYDNPRRSELVIDYDEIDIADLIEKEDVVISMTHYGYIKRLPTTEYKAQHRGGKGITAHRPKEEDFVENMFVTNTHDTLLYFTNYGRVYAAKAYEIPEAERTARGRAIVNLLQLGDGEKVSAVIPIKDDEYKGNLVMATKRGMIKKTALTEFKLIRKVGKVAIKLMDDDELISVQHTGGIDEILIASQTGKCIRFSEENVRLMGRDTQGVRAMKLASDDNVVDMAIVRPECDVLTVSRNGFGKRVDIEEFRLQSRAGKGIKAGTFNEKTGRLVNMKLVDPEDDVMVISDNGTIIRMLVKEISKISRDTQGVRMMRVKNQGQVVCVATAPHQEVIEDEGEPAAPAEE
ncbi:MAG: DNA gyrase subunit A [Clostridia bacterium]|jgi:DNA gyrase subunit A|nr:DNA gyrase subunit A [Clostridia bacterium]